MTFEHSASAPVPSAKAVSVAVWCSMDQAEMLRRVFADPRLHLAGVCAVEGAQTGALASTLGCAVIDDPRRLAAAPEIDVAWLAADRELPSQGRRSASGRAATVTTALPGGEAWSDRSALRTAMLTSEALASPEVVTLLSELGAVHSVAMERGAWPELGGLGAALFDVADLSCGLLESPDLVSASIVGLDGRDLRPSGLRRLAGSATIHVRDAAGRGMAATIAGALPRRAVIVAERGRLVVGDRGVTWFDARGAMVDAIGAPATVEPDPLDSALEAVRTALVGAATGQGEAPPRPSEWLAVRLALCEAARLSALTGVAESAASLHSAFRAEPTAPAAGP